MAARRPLPRRAGPRRQRLDSRRGGRALTVTVFVATGCPHCDRLVDDLRRRRVAFRHVDVLLEPDGLRELASHTRERRVPVVVDHERCSIGFAGGSTPLDALAVERLAILTAEGGVVDA